MKIKPEHYAHMRSKIALVAEDWPAHRAAVIAEGKAKDIDKRVRWDALWAAGLSPWLVATIYPYANDDHVDTALRSIAKELGL